MPVRINTPESIAVKERFLRSFEELRYRGIVSLKSEFARNVGLGTASNLNRMENNRREPAIVNVLLLHQKYNVSIEWIMFGMGDFLCEDKKSKK